MSIKKDIESMDTFRKDVKGLLLTFQDYFVKTGNLTVVELFEKYFSGTLDEYAFNEELLDYMQEVFLEERAKCHFFGEIIIQGNQYPMGSIHSLTVEDKYSFEKKKTEYRLILNKTTSDKVLIGNVIFVFDTAEKRQKEIDRINNIRMVFNGLRLLK